MKKKLLLLALLTLTLVLTGCSDVKTLTCTKESSNNSMTITEERKIESRKDIVTKIESTITEVTDKDSASLNESIYKQAFIAYNAVAGVEATSTLVNDETTRYTVSINLETIDLPAYENLCDTAVVKTILDRNITKDMKVTDYQSANLSDYTCK